MGSLLSLTSVRFLAKLAELALLGQDEWSSSNAVEQITAGLGLLIGFSWQRGFSIAMNNISLAMLAKFPCPTSVYQLLISVGLVLLVFPAWRHYILQTDSSLST